MDIEPLGYEDLVSSKLHRPVTIPLRLNNGRVVETDIEGMDTSKPWNISTTLESPFTSRAMSLVRGGWLPSALAAVRDNAVILPDRNIISEVVGRFEAGKTTGREPDFLDLFAGSNVRINPLLAAMEGNARTIPTPEAAQAQLDEAVRKLGKALPEATLMVHPNSITGLVGLIEDVRPSFVRKQALLRELAPILSPPTAQRDIDARWHRVLGAANEHGLPRASLLERDEFRPAHSRPR